MHPSSNNNKWCTPVPK